MTLFEALKEVLAGKRITRALWMNPDNYVYLKFDGLVSIHLSKENTYNSWAISKQDLEAEDWYTIEE